jgi:exopolysaccharide production protein ExoQ
MRFDIDHGRALFRLEQLFVVVTIFVFLGPYALIFPDEPLTANPQIQIIFSGFYIVAGALLLREFRSSPLAFRPSPIMLLIACVLLISIASTMWSIIPHITLRRSMALAGTTVVGLYVACRFSFIDFLRLAAISLGLVLVSTLLLWFIFPDKIIVQETHIGAWRGLFYHKNELGEAMLQAILVFVALAVSEKSKRRRMMQAILTATAMFVLLMAGSITAMTALGVFFLVLIALRVPKMTAYVLAALIGAMLLIVVGMFEDSLCVLFIVDRDCTITGRTEIWSLAWSAAMERPWLGYGFGAFWAGESEIGNAIRAELGWPVMSAHNAWLDTWLSIGVLGVGVTLLTLSALSVKILRRAFASKDPATNAWTVWSIGFLVSAWAYSLSESSLLAYNTLTWVLFIVLAVKTEHFGQCDSESGRLDGGRGFFSER